MAGVIIRNGKLAIVPDDYASLARLQKILAKLNQYEGIVMVVEEMDERSSFLIEIRLFGRDVWRIMQNLLDDIGENLDETVSGRIAALQRIIPA